MSTKFPTDAQLHVANAEGQYVFVHPETNLKQVIDMETGKSLNEILKTVGTSEYKVAPFSLVATSAGQTEFTFTDPEFDAATDVPVIYVNGEFMHPDEEYSITKVGDVVTVTLVEGVKVNDKVFINVHRLIGLLGIKPITAHLAVAETAGQTKFTYEVEDFDAARDIIMVYMNGEFMHPNEEFIAKNTPNGLELTLTQGIAVGDKVFINVHRNLGSSSSGGGSGLSEADKRKLSLINTDAPIQVEITVDGVNGSDDNNGIDAPFKTIKAAIDLVHYLGNSISNGNSQVNVSITPGVYDESIYINNIPNIINLCIGISADSLNTDRVVVKDMELWFTNRVVMRGFEFKSTDKNYGLMATHCGDISVHVCTINGSTFGIMGGIKITQCDSLRSTDNIYKDCTRHTFVVESTLAYSHRDSFINSTESNISHGSILGVNGMLTPEPHIANSDSIGLDYVQVNKGIIVESGSNENGNFVKYADGTLICYHNANNGEIKLNNLISGVNFSDSFSWIYPMKFANTPPSIHRDIYYTGGIVEAGVGDVASTNIHSSYKISSQFTNHVDFCGISLYAIGRWK